MTNADTPFFVASVPERSGGAEAESEGLATFGGGIGPVATEATARAVTL
ncbi:MAG: hypothetical protein ACYC64_05135 [Armatimonadota bacterium]